MPIIDLRKDLMRAEVQALDQPTGEGTQLEPLTPCGQEQLVKPEDRRSLLAKQIIARRAMARGVVVLDENLFCLESALRGANIKVVNPPSGSSDDLIKEQLLYHRIIITRNPADFVLDAPVHEYGVVALDKLSFIDIAHEYSKNTTVRLISRALSEDGLWAKGAKFLLELHDDGNHVLSELS